MGERGCLKTSKAIQFHRRDAIYGVRGRHECRPYGDDCIVLVSYETVPFVLDNNLFFMQRINMLPLD